MADADVWMAFVNGNTVTISDRISTGRSNPATDASQDLTLVPGQSQVNANGSYTVTFTRPLTTNDATDKPLTPAANQAFIWGVGASANGQISRHTARGAITVSQTVSLQPRGFLLLKWRSKHCFGNLGQLLPRRCPVSVRPRPRSLQVPCCCPAKGALLQRSKAVCLRYCHWCQCPHLHPRYWTYTVRFHRYW
jgi:hypothetical protein